MTHLDLNRVLGHVQLSSRWVSCPCGTPVCGHFVNRTVEIGRDGTVLSDTESICVRTMCSWTPPKPRAKHWLLRLFT